MIVFDHAGRNQTGWLRRLTTMLLVWLLAVCLRAQEPGVEPRIRTTVPLVLVPASVTDKNGKPVAGLAKDDFVLYDASRQASHELEVTTQPISVVLCVQTNKESGPALAKVLKIGSLFLPLIAGEGGSGAVLTFSDHVSVRQDFTADQDKFTQAIQSLRPDGFGARMIDATEVAMRMLNARGERQRKVLIVVGEAKDRGSESKLDDVLERAVRSNVTIYTVSFSVYMTAFTSRGDERFGEKRSDDADKHDSRERVYAQGAGFSLITALVELSRLGKTNTAEALSKSTGGERLSFLRLKALEQMVQKIGEDLHNQYLLSFVPASGAAEGYRDIRVKVKNRPEVAIRARPGYWAQP